MIRRKNVANTKSHLHLYSYSLAHVHLSWFMRWSQEHNKSRKCGIRRIQILFHTFIFLHLLTLQYGGQTFCQSWKLDRSSSTIWSHVTLSFFHFFLGSPHQMTVKFSFFNFIYFQIELRADNVNKNILANEPLQFVVKNLIEMPKSRYFCWSMFGRKRW